MGIKCFLLVKVREEREEFADGGSVTRPVYRRADTGEEMTWNAAPAGAMAECPWHQEEYPGPDGKCYMVKTPGGTWVIDGPASHGGRPWTRTGTPPLLTVTPSINIVGSYHGWLRNGELIEA